MRLFRVAAEKTLSEYSDDDAHQVRCALDSLRADVLMMASLTDRNLQNAMSCLLDRDAELCAPTISDEEEVDALEKRSIATVWKYWSGISQSLLIYGMLSPP